MNSVYEWVQTNIVEVINGALEEYGCNKLVFFIMLVSCITLLFINKELMKRANNILAVYSVLLLVLVLLNPLFLICFDGIFELFALLPMCTIIACVIASRSFNLTNRIKTNALLISLSIIIIVAGFVIKDDEYVDSINLYKTDDQGILVAQYICENAGGKPVTVSYILRDGEQQGADISASEAVKQYSGLLYTDAIPIYDANEEIVSDYLVLHDEIADAGSIDKTGYTVVLDTGYYTVLAKG